MTTPRFRFKGTLADLDRDARDSRVVLERSMGDVEQALAEVAPLRDAVRERGDAALIELTERFDGVKIENVILPPSEATAALERIPASLRRALEVAHANIRRFHEAQRREDLDVEVEPGLRAGRREVPLERVGCYVPGGRARYPSTVLMTVTPAKAAGVGDVTVATPPSHETGRVDDATLAACALAGADRIVQVGGAQAVFAFAYGTESVPRVDKVVGPGNVFVTAAKLLASAHVATDAPAGPSEVLVVAEEGGAASIDEVAEAAARELLAQAEHDPDAAVALVTSSAAVLDAVEARVGELAPKEARSDILTASIERRGALLLAPDAAAALAFVDRYAPEHLVLLTSEPEKDLRRVKHYGSAFLGPHASVAFGDYAAGPNHVLPTAGFARAMSGLSVDDFIRRPTHTRATAEAAARLAPVVAEIARAEGLDAHAGAAESRGRSR